MASVAIILTKASLAASQRNPDFLFYVGTLLKQNNYQFSRAASVTDFKNDIDEKSTTGDDSFGIQTLIDFLNNHLKVNEWMLLKASQKTARAITLNRSSGKVFRARQARLAVAKDALIKKILRAARTN